MIDKFKQWLGIEGIKVKILIPEEIEKDSGFVDGRLVFGSKNIQTLTSIEVKMLEIYTRGRGSDQKIDEYEIGSIQMEEEMTIYSGEETHIDFALPYRVHKSEMDNWEEKNLLTKGLSKVAKTIQKVESTYRIEVRAKVRGTALDPFDKAYIKLI